MEFERTFDYPFIKSVMTHRALWPVITEDTSPSAEDYEPPQTELVWYVKAGVHGLFVFVPISGVQYEVHTCLLPSAWKHHSVDLGRGVIEWIWANSQARRIITQVPDYNRLALSFAKKCGLIEFGYNPDSFLKHGKLYGLHLLGISKEPPCPQH